jgi:hypothetical protein
MILIEANPFRGPLEGVSAESRDFLGPEDSVVDPYSFFPDPDSEFDVGDQYGSGSKSGSGSNTDPGL